MRWKTSRYLSASGKALEYVKIKNKTSIFQRKSSLQVRVCGNNCIKDETKRANDNYPKILHDYMAHYDISAKSGVLYLWNYSSST